jgi:D-3-phosphoglycerate dehydrogenase
MSELNSKSSIRILFIGQKVLYDEIINRVPKSWSIIKYDSISQFLSKPVVIDFILDSSIREIIDLNFKEFANVKIVACASTGTNHVKQRFDNSRPSKIYSLKDIPSTLNKLTSAGEFSFGLLIALAKQILPATKAVESGVWNRTDFSGTTLKDKRIGIVGYGRIGKAMATFARSFDMRVGFFDPYIQSASEEITRYDSVESLVSISDFVSIHIPYSENIDKNPFFTKRIFSLFKPGSYLINTSRGEIIDEDGLIAAFENGIIAGAALDVLIGEPNILTNRLYRYAKQTKANIIFTPHIAGYSIENVRTATLGILDFLLIRTSEISYCE